MAAFQRLRVAHFGRSWRMVASISTARVDHVAGVGQRQLAAFA
jgi:hypothetical protein